MGPRDDHAALFARVSAELIAEQDVEMTVQTIVDKACDLVPGVDYASITVERKGEPFTLSTTSDVATRCDLLQYELGEGPCIEALDQAEWYRSGDIGTDSRWPLWGPRAAEQGIGSMVAVRLALSDKPIGALNLYGTEVGRFDNNDDLQLIFLFAIHAATAIGATQEIEGLQVAMHTRHTIGVAQGILMQRYDLGLDRSFELLRRYSQARQMKLADLAAYLVEHQELPPEADGVLDDSEPVEA